MRSSFVKKLLLKVSFQEINFKETNFKKKAYGRLGIYHIFTQKVQLDRILTTDQTVEVRILPRLPKKAP